MRRSARSTQRHDEHEQKDPEHPQVIEIVRRIDSRFLEEAMTQCSTESMQVLQ